jgi:hypothetical protein
VKRRLLIESENFLPKVDGVTRTLARLLEHLKNEGHQCMLLGPGSGMDSYAGHPLVGTAGVPLVVYPGLKVGDPVSSVRPTSRGLIEISSTFCVQSF